MTKKNESTSVYKTQPYLFPDFAEKHVLRMFLLPLLFLRHGRCFHHPWHFGLPPTTTAATAATATESLYLR